MLLGLGENKLYYDILTGYHARVELLHKKLQSVEKGDKDEKSEKSDGNGGAGSVNNGVGSIVDRGGSGGSGGTGGSGGSGGISKRAETEGFFTLIQKMFTK